MITEPGATRIWRVKLRSPRSRCEWHFASRDRAELFVETKVGRQNARWKRKHRGEWVVSHKDRTYTVEEIELVGAAGILVDETAPNPP